MKVILTTLTTYRTEDTFIESTFTGESGYPLGIMYIQSYLKSKNHDVDVLDFIQVPFDESKQKLMNTIESFHPEIIGFSVLTGNHINTFRMMESIHELYPNIKIVLGGIHVTIMYEQVIKKYPYVIAVIGEGEITFSELSEDIPLHSINGIAFFSEGNVIKTENREMINDLDILPFPSHSTLTSKSTFANIITSRGCPASCSFCVLNPNAKRVCRIRTVKNVVDEVESVLKNYPNIKRIYFIDDAFLTNNKRVIELCKEIINRKLNNIDYQCQARIKPFHKELIPSLEQANFKTLLFGMETANENMLKMCHKNIKQKDIINTMILLKKSKIRVGMFIIVGLPGETKDTIIETAKFIQKIQKIKYIMYNFNYKIEPPSLPPILNIYPGTEVYETAKKSGKITDDYWLTNNSPPFYTVEHSLEELNEFRDELIKYIAFMPFSINKLKYQYYMIPSIAKYVLRYYKTHPLLLLRNYIANVKG